MNLRLTDVYGEPYCELRRAALDAEGVSLDKERPDHGELGVSGDIDALKDQLNKQISEEREYEQYEYVEHNQTALKRVNTALSERSSRN